MISRRKIMSMLSGGVVGLVAHKCLALCGKKEEEVIPLFDCTKGPCCVKKKIGKYAIEYEWFNAVGQTHRDDGPARILVPIDPKHTTVKEWYMNDKPYKSEYYKNGQLVAGKTVKI